MDSYLPEVYLRLIVYNELDCISNLSLSFLPPILGTTRKSIKIYYFKMKY